MNVVEEKIDDLNAILRVAVQPEDYAEKVSKTLNNYRKQANIPGFRPGKIPMGVIQKKYGRAILAEELNKLVNESLNDFIRTNNLNILGNPLPKYDEEVTGDFMNPTNFVFAYEIGIAPNFELDLSAKTKIDYLKIDVSKEMLDREVENLARRYGSLISADTVSAKDMVLGEFVQKGGEIKNTSTISIEFITDELVKNNLIGQKIGAVLTLDPRQVSRGDEDMAAMLGISKEDAAALSGDFDFTITEIKTMIPAAIDQALFDKLFGPDVVHSEIELRDKIAIDLERMFANDSDRVFSQKISDKLISTTDLPLPEDFLKRWILATSEKKITVDELNRDFGTYSKSLKWQLIQNKIVKENGIRVENSEMINYTKGLLANQFAQYGIPAPDDTALEEQAKTVLKNREEADKIYETVYGTKMINFFKSTVNLNEKVLSYDDFMKEAYAQN